MTYGDLDLWDTVIRRNMCTPGYVLDVCTKNEGDWAYGLGRVSEHTDRQTNRGPYAIDSIDYHFTDTERLKKTCINQTLTVTWLLVEYLWNLQEIFLNICIIIWNKQNLI